jgi:ribosomal protein L7/L12
VTADSGCVAVTAFAGFGREGTGTEEAQSEVRKVSASTVALIKSIHAAFGVSLAAAKQIFSQSHTWSSELQAAEAFHVQMCAILAKENNHGNHDQ